MIESGWIFPDGSEYECGGGKGSLTHNEIVRQYVESLSHNYPEIKKRINRIYNDLLFTTGSSEGLREELGIVYLGWIQIGCGIRQIIRFAWYDWQSELIQPYEEQGYFLDDRFACSFEKYIPIPYDSLKILKESPTEN